MGRPERSLDPTRGPVESFAHQLRELRERAGRPSYASMARRAHRSQTALSEAAGGERLPTWDTTEAYVRACSGDCDEWRERWSVAVRSMQPPPPEEPTPDASDAPPAEAPTRDGRRRVVLLGVAAAVLVGATATGTAVVVRARARTSSPVATSASAADVVGLHAVADGADPKDSGCALDPGVVTLDSLEVDYLGQPAGMVQLRYSPRCGVAWPRFEPFPKATIPAGALIHVDAVRPGSNNLRLPFAARYTGVPVYGNVMLSTSQCVYAASSIEAGGHTLPESRTHCFRGRTAELAAG